MALPIAVEKCVASRRWAGRCCCDRCVGTAGCSGCMNWWWWYGVCSSKQSVAGNGELGVMQRNVGASRQRRILFWTLMRQRVFATAQKLPPLRLHQPLTFTCFNLIYRTLAFYAKPSLDYNIDRSSCHFVWTHLQAFTSLYHSCCPTASFIAFTGDRGDLRASNVMLHCTTRYRAPLGRSPLFRI